MLKMRLKFSKVGLASYISHLDVMRTFFRAFIRAEYPLKHSNGYNPHPLMSIAHPLPLGFSGLNEVLDCELQCDDAPDILKRINAVLPSGLYVVNAAPPVAQIKEIAFAGYDISLIYDNNTLDKLSERFSDIFSASKIEIEKKTKRGTATVDIVPYISNISFSQNSEHEVTAKLLLKVEEAPLNPKYIIDALKNEGFSPDFVRYTRTGFKNKNMEEFI